MQGFGGFQEQSYVHEESWNQAAGRGHHHQLSPFKNHHDGTTFVETDTVYMNGGVRSCPTPPPPGPMCNAGFEAPSYGAMRAPYGREAVVEEVVYEKSSFAAADGGYGAARGPCPMERRPYY